MSELNDIFAKALNHFAQHVDEVTIPYLKELEGSTKQRIHNKGVATDGTLIGQNKGNRYSPGYEKKKGKKVGAGNLYPINLQYDGDLLRSFTVGTSAGKPVLRFQDQANSDKAAYLEKLYKKDIYRPSEEQLADTVEVLRIGVEKVLKNAFV